MKTYAANHSFLDDRLGRVKRDQRFNFDEQQAASYVRAGLLRVVVTEADMQPENPIPAAGIVQSVLPVAPASQPPIVQPRKRGRKPKAVEQSLL